jgi:hypothetical protein
VLAGEPASLDRGDVLDLRTGLESLSQNLGFLDPVEAEVADVLAAAVIRGDVPALRSIGQR